MELEGKIIKALPEHGGTSQRTGNAWKSQEFVIETHEQYPRKCCFRVFGIERLAQFAIKEGEELRVSVDIDAHEYNGRWFNDISAWKVERIDATAQAAGNVQPQTQAQSVQPKAPVAQQDSSDPADDLPF